MTGWTLVPLIKLAMPAVRRDEACIDGIRVSEPLSCPGSNFTCKPYSGVSSLAHCKSYAVQHTPLQVHFWNLSISITDDLLLKK